MAAGNLLFMKTRFLVMFLWLAASCSIAASSGLPPATALAVKSPEQARRNDADLPRLWRWSLTPGRVAAGTTTRVTLTGDDFPVGTSGIELLVMGSANIQFTDIAVQSRNTITALLHVPQTTDEGNYRVRLDVPVDTSADSLKYAASSAVALTVSDQDREADMVDIAMSVGFPGAHGLSAGLLVRDLDQDKYDDVLFITHSPNPELLFDGKKGAVSFRPIMNAKDRHQCDSADVDGDGLIDIYCSVGSVRGNGIGVNDLWLRQKDGSYIDVADKWGVTDPYGRGRDVVFLHANDDDRPDLFVSNWGPRPDGKNTPNRLFINQDGKRYVAAPEFGVDAELPASCALTVDFNNDGFDDLVVCSRSGFRMFANQAGKGFVNVAADYGLERFKLRAKFADIDGDGDLDIAFVKGNLFEIHRLRLPDENPPYNDGVVFSMPAQGGRSLAFGDVNGDQLPDVYFLQKGCRDEGENNLADFLALNEGDTFSVLNPTSVTRGCGDAVAAFDHDRDGRDGFIVTNGRGRYGPLQYLVLP